MTESSTIEAPTLSQDTLDRLAELRRQRRAITHEIKEILGSVIEDIVARPTVECLRCGFVWTPHSPAIRPRACARCVTTAWDKPPTATSRKPSDPPSPSWRVRTGERRPRMQPEPKRIRYRRTREQVELDEAEKKKWESPARGILVPAPPLVPPRISALLPPPPSPSLSQWLREAVAAEESKPMVYDGVVIEDASEPQPERVSSHAAPTMTQAEKDDIYAEGYAKGVAMVEEIAGRSSNQDMEITEPASVIVGAEEQVSSRVDRPEAPLPIEVPPESIGAPRTDAEREELARAKEEVWPTTRGDE